MARWEPSEVLPWEPIPPREQVPVPGNEQGIDDLVDGRVEVGGGVDRDDELLAELQELQRQAAGSGGSGGRGKITATDFPEEPQPPTDALAWYVTFRTLDRWGVYISKSGRRSVARYLVSTGADPLEAHDTSWYLLRNHESAHFLVDRAVLTLESGLLVTTGHRHNLWLDRRRSLPFDELEEAVCNAYAYRMAVAHERSPLKQIRNFILGQPAGYRDIDFGKGKGRQAAPDGLTRSQAESQLLSNYLAGTVTSGRRVVGLDSLMGYERPRSGTRGGNVLRVSDREKRELPVYRVA